MNKIIQTYIENKYPITGTESTINYLTGEETGEYIYYINDTRLHIHIFSEKVKIYTEGYENLENELNRLLRLELFQ